MSAEVGLHLIKTHFNKLHKGKTLQLTHAQLHNALNMEPNAHIHMLKKHVSELLRNHRNGKGFRFKPEKIVGGKLNFKAILRTLKRGAKRALEFGKQVMKDPVVRDTAKQLGHFAVATATQKLADSGMDNAGAYGTIAHQAIEGHNMKDTLKHQVSSDLINHATHMAMEGTGRKKGGRVNVGRKVMKKANEVMKNPIAQGVATNLITGAMMGAGKRGRKKKSEEGGALNVAGKGAKKGDRYAKGSAEAKAHMARLRAMRKKK
jgi:hypothetical protein